LAIKKKIKIKELSILGISKKLESKNLPVPGILKTTETKNHWLWVFQNPKKSHQF
jgi:hypothetical protein